MIITLFVFFFVYMMDAGVVKQIVVCCFDTEKVAYGLAVYTEEIAVGAGHYRGDYYGKEQKRI